jgi:hypothetical protein
MLAETKAALPALQVLASTPASRDDIMQILGRRFAIYPQPDRSDGEWASWWSDYTDALEGIPAPAIDAGMAAYVSLPDSEFFPKPGKLAALAKSTPNEAALALRRARAAVENADHQERIEKYWVAPEPEPVRRPLTKEEIERDQAAVRELARNLASVLKAPESQRAKPRPNYGKTDDTGITPELRKIMASK